MRHYVKSKKGFTLVEMIISVAFLAVISLVLVELFISAQNCSRKAHDLDQGVHIAKKMVETFKAGDSPEDFVNSEIVGNSNISEFGGTITIKTYYDEAWQILNPTDDLLQDKAAFMAVAEINPVLPAAGNYTANGMYEIRILIDKSKPYLMERASAGEIYSLTADEYFSKLVQRNEYGGA